MLGGRYSIFSTPMTPRLSVISILAKHLRHVNLATSSLRASKTISPWPKTSSIPREVAAIRMGAPPSSNGSIIIALFLARKLAASRPQLTEVGFSGHPAMPLIIQFFYRPLISIVGIFGSGLEKLTRVSCGMPSSVATATSHDTEHSAHLPPA